MRQIVLVLMLLLIGCGSGESPDTTINIATGTESSAGDPVTEDTSGCANSEDACDTLEEN